MQLRSFQDLKNFCATLDAEQLKKPIKVLEGEAPMRVIFFGETAKSNLLEGDEYAEWEDEISKYDLPGFSGKEKMLCKLDPFLSSEKARGTNS